LSSEDFNYLSTVYYQRVGRQKKHVCGCEGTVAGKGSHTLAFVGWVFLFSLFLWLNRNSRWGKEIHQAKIKDTR
jgi:hypothetical protein